MSLINIETDFFLIFIQNFYEICAHVMTKNL